MSAHNSYMRRFTLQERALLGRVIRRIRLRLRLSQVEFASQFKTVQPIVSEWECGTRFPNQGILLCIAGMGRPSEAEALKLLALRVRPHRRSDLASPHNTSIGSRPEECNV